MPPSGRVRAAVRRHPLVVDGVVAALLLLLVLLVRGPDDDATRGLDDPPASIVLAALTCAAVVLRSRRPALAVAATTAGTALVTLLGGGREPLVLAVLLALYALAVRTDRRTAVTAWALSAAALTVGPLVAGRSFDVELLSSVPWVGLGAAVGDAVRNGRAHIAALEERARRAERTREDEARRRVAEERLHIARELHDVVAHQMSVVTVQAGVAGHLLRTAPDAAEEALGHVRRAGAAVLDELGDILAVLRRSDDGPDPTAPSPGLDRLDDLVASFGALGLQVTRSATGRPRPLGPATDLVAYRVVEEALTNAHKHGAGTARVALRWAPAALAVEVTNPVRSAGGDGSGHGLVGMRERATAVGGSLRAGPTGDGRFRVVAELPVPAVVPA